ncbi:MAG: FGGY-family carbohydrate kinase [Gammaproteobacteria bacterium]|nr:FGGY-family carbohydrate kinase [Gammaproteobacteria bacterium]
MVARVPELAGELTSASARAPDAVVCTGGTRTEVLVGAGNIPLRPAIMWDDSRAVDLARSLAREHDAPGNPVTAYHPAARPAWLAEHEAELVAGARAVLQPRTTSSRARRRYAHRRDIGPDAPRRARTPSRGTGRRERLSPRPAAARGAARDSGRRSSSGRRRAPGRGRRPRGVRVDGHRCAALALGAWRAGAAYDLSGTSEVVGVIHATRSFREGLLTVPWGRGLWHLGGPSQCGGGTVEWARTVLGLGPGELDELLAETTISAHSPLFIPYLDGERTPLWNPALTGSWQALRTAHGPADLLGAVVEGIAFHARTILERAASGATPVLPVAVGGGLARSRHWCRVRADVFGRPVARITAAEPGLTGAAMLAATALGWHVDLAAAADRMAAPADVFEPDSDRAALIEARYTRFTHCVQTLQSAPAEPTSAQ